MARSAGYTARGGIRRRFWEETLAAAKRRLFETFGWGLLLSAILLTATLLSYRPGDPSLDTAGTGPAHNFLGQDGALLADLLRQSFGLAAFAVPIVMLGWSLRLILNRPVSNFGRKLLLLPAVLVLAALALSVLG